MRPSLAKQAEGSDRGRGNAAAIAGLISLGVAQILLLFVDQRELLLAFTAVLAVLLYALRRGLRAWHLRDGVVDQEEHVYEDVFTLLGLLAAFCAINYAVQIALDLFLASTQLQVANLLLILGVLIMLALSYVPSVRKMVLGPASS